MKRMNFPGRVNKRRKEAVDRLIRAKEKASDKKRLTLKETIRITRERLLEQAEAENIRTKIHRGK